MAKINPRQNRKVLVSYLNFLYICNIENEMDFESLTRKKYFSRALGKFLSCGGKNETRIDDNQFIKLTLKIYYKNYGTESKCD